MERVCTRWETETWLNTEWRCVAEHVEFYYEYASKKMRKIYGISFDHKVVVMSMGLLVTVVLRVVSRRCNVGYRMWDMERDNKGLNRRRERYSG